MHILVEIWYFHLYRYGALYYKTARGGLVPIVGVLFLAFLSDWTGWGFSLVFMLLWIYFCPYVMVVLERFCNHFPMFIDWGVYESKRILRRRKRLEKSIIYMDKSVYMTFQDGNPELEGDVAISLEQLIQHSGLKD